MSTTGQRLCAAYRPSDDPHTSPGDCWATPGAHLPGCDGTPCKGCLPRLAQPGLAVCTRCRSQLIRQLEGQRSIPASDHGHETPHVPSLAQLHKDLLQPTQAGPGGARPEGAEQPQTLADGALEARTEIEHSLHAWNTVLDGRIGPYSWGETTIGKWGIQPPFAGARWLEETRQPDRTVRSMAARLLRHADRLLADDAYAPGLVRDITAVHTEARRRAYPTRPIGSVIGECPVGRPGGETCGGTVRAVVDVADQTGWATCNTCKEGAVIEWWQARMPAEKWLNMKALTLHLLLNCGRSVPETTIRGWAATSGGRTAELPTEEDRSGNILYFVERARELCALHRTRGQAKLTPDQVREIRGRYEAGGISTKQLGREYGVTGEAIRLLAARRTYDHVA